MGALLDGSHTACGAVAQFERGLAEVSRVDRGAGVGAPLMAAGGGAGAVTVWDLEARRLATVVRDAHDAPLTGLHFFAGEPRLLSGGADNALKQWLFDAPDGAARLLRFRSGHAAPPAVVRFYGEAGTRLLSAGAACGGPGHRAAVACGMRQWPGGLKKLFRERAAGWGSALCVSAGGALRAARRAGAAVCLCRQARRPAPRHALRLARHAPRPVRRHEQREPAAGSVSQPRAPASVTRPRVLTCRRRARGAGQDRAFRMFSVVQDAQSAELSQRHVARRAKRLKVDQAELKLPRVVALDACQARRRGGPALPNSALDWDHLLTKSVASSVAGMHSTALAELHASHVHTTAARQHV